VARLVDQFASRSVPWSCPATSKPLSAAQVDVDLSFPFLLFAVALVSVVGPSLTALLGG
jgi:hypothetical protein